MNNTINVAHLAHWVDTQLSTIIEGVSAGYSLGNYNSVWIDKVATVFTIALSNGEEYKLDSDNYNNAEEIAVAIIRVADAKQARNLKSAISRHQESKMKHPDAIILLRVGDFYETFADDAITVSEVCGIILTRRAIGKSASTELAGFPHHSLDVYLPKLVRAGHRVAIYED